ncbi:MAG: hypothetical protein HYZ00_08245, partial [Candidatus Hydrogenedentes bacterium]|nr:hypothetical protein [Candidatus Hydrogenedentota bacterium]
MPKMLRPLAVAVGAVLCLAVVVVLFQVLPAREAADLGRAASNAPDAAGNAEIVAKLEKKVAKGLKPYDAPAEANEFFLQQRTGGAPLDYKRVEEAKAAAAALPKATFGVKGVFIHPADASKGELEKQGFEVNDWTELGPGNIGGRVRSILIDPANANIMYAGAVAGGIWKTTNGGSSWDPLTDDMANLAVVTLAFERQGSASVNTSVIYAGTGEGYFNGDAVRGAGIFKSTNAGQTWARLSSTNSFDFFFVNKIVASPENANVVYCATQTGVFKTTNGGQSWNELIRNNGSGGSNGSVVRTGIGFSDIELRSDLAADILVANNGSFISDGIYRSIDGGATWNRVLNRAGIGRSDIAIAPSNQSIMYALTADNTNQHRLLNVFKSTDGGANWQSQIPGGFDQRNADWLLLSNPIVANLQPCFGSGDAIISQGWYDNIIAVAPHNPNIVFAGGIDLMRSDDGGATWGLISYWWISATNSAFTHADQHTIVFHPGWNGTSNQILYAGNDGGIFRTNNALGTRSGGSGGAPNIDGVCFNAPSLPTAVDWLSLNNAFRITQFYNGRPFPPGEDGFFGGAQDNGTVFGTDATGIDGWEEINGGDGGYVSFDETNPLIMFAETTGKSMIRSTDGGRNFSDIVNGAGQISESTNNFMFIAPFRHDPSNPNRLWYGGNRPWRSNNASSAPTPAQVTWTQAGAQFPGDGEISAWAIAPGNSNIVFAGTTDGRVMKVTSATTSTSGTAWQQVTPPFSDDAFISWIEVDPNDASGNTVYATNSRFDSEHVMRSTNGGGAWTNIESNLPNVPVHCLVVKPGTAATLFVGTDQGVFVSNNTGGSWANMNTPNFSNTVVEGLEFQDAITLFAFTHGRGAYRAIVGPAGGEGEGEGEGEGRVTAGIVV